MVMSDWQRLGLFVAASVLVHALVLAVLGQTWTPLPPLPPAAPPPPMIEVTLLPPPIIIKKPVAPPKPPPVRPKPTPIAPPKIQPPKPIKIKPQPVRPRPRLQATPKPPSPPRHPAPPKRPAAAPAGASAPSMAAGITKRPETPQKPAAAPQPQLIAKADPHSDLAQPAPDKGVGSDIAPPALPSGEGAGGGQTPGTGAGNGHGVGQGRGETGAGPGSGGNGKEPFGLGGGGHGSGEGPRHIVYILDVSGSMISRINRAERELREALAGMGPDESFDIIAFSDGTQPFDTKLVPATPANVSQANEFLNSLRVLHGTNFEMALRQAFALSGVNVVFIITDGMPSVGETDTKKLLRLTRHLNQGRARIYTVGLVGKDPAGEGDPFEAADFLRQMSRDSGGESKIVTLGDRTPQ